MTVTYPMMRSNAPTSQLVPCGRVTPALVEIVTGVVEQTSSSPASIARAFGVGSHRLRVSAIIREWHRARFRRSLGRRVPAAPIAVNVLNASAVRVPAANLQSPPLVLWQ